MVSPLRGPQAEGRVKCVTGPIGTPHTSWGHNLATWAFFRGTPVSSVPQSKARRRSYSWRQAPRTLWACSRGPWDRCWQADGRRREANSPTKVFSKPSITSGPPNSASGEECAGPLRPSGLSGAATVLFRFGTAERAGARARAPTRSRKEAGKASKRAW